MSADYFSQNPPDQIQASLGSGRLKEVLSKMLLIRQFETRGEAAYQQGFIGGFYHAYSGQEAIGCAAVEAFGQDSWYTATYRCHALALLLGATPRELMAELFGKETGNAKGRGGSMHLYADRLLGGFGIVGGHLPIAAGAAFSSKYLKKKEVSVCFLGDGAVAQGAFHETMNLVSLWNLPAVFIIENNQWGMGTAVNRAIATKRIAEKQAPSYDMEGLTLNGMDFFNCYDGFQYAHEKVLKTNRPMLIECVCERFRGHSISDPGLYRTKEELSEAMKRDPITFLAAKLGIDEKTFKDLEKEAKATVLDSLEFAKESKAPSIATLGEGVYAP